MIECVTEIDVEALPVLKTRLISEKIRPKVGATVVGSVEEARGGCRSMLSSSTKLSERQVSSRSTQAESAERARSTHRTSEPAMVLANGLEGEHAREREGSLEQCFPHSEVHLATAGLLRSPGLLQQELFFGEID